MVAPTNGTGMQPIYLFLVEITLNASDYSTVRLDRITCVCKGYKLQVHTALDLVNSAYFLVCITNGDM